MRNEFGMLLGELRDLGARDAAEETASWHTAQAARLRAYTPVRPPDMAKSLNLEVESIDVGMEIVHSLARTRKSSVFQRAQLASTLAALEQQRDAVLKSFPPNQTATTQARVDLLNEQRSQISQATAKLRALVAAGRLTGLDAARYEARIHALAERIR